MTTIKGLGHLGELVFKCRAVYLSTLVVMCFVIWVKALQGMQLSHKERGQCQSVLEAHWECLSERVRRPTSCFFLKNEIKLNTQELDLTALQFVSLGKVFPLMAAPFHSLRPRGQ